MRRDGIERTGPKKAASAIATAVALLLASLPPAGVTAQPRTLTSLEMDGVTAGGLRIDAVAFAQASGDFALARTRTDAIVSTTDEMELGIGVAEGLAFACCDPASAVAVHSRVGSTGQTLHSNAYAVTFRGAIPSGDGQSRHFTYGFTAAFLVATSSGVGDAGEQAVRVPWDHLGGSLSTLVGIGQTEGRGGVVSGFEFAPVVEAGLRWRLFQGFLTATPTGSLSLRPSPTPLSQAVSTPVGLLR